VKKIGIKFVILLLKLARIYGIIPIRVAPLGVTNRQS